jgi:hypothetical protein
MQRTDFANNDLQRSEYEAACRDFWSAFVMIETGHPPDRPSKRWIKVRNPNAPPPQPELKTMKPY